MINEKALFIGPFGENKEQFIKWVNTLLEDVVQWRRNFHPNDPRLITPKEQREESFLSTQDAVSEALDRLLGEMKQSVPFHSPRFLGHMHSDLVMPALLGYFAGMLYNQNNVVGESSPITTRKEIEFSTRMCQMLGFAPFGLKHEKEKRSWGHLCSGGTTANLEAVWVSRNLKYYPIAIKLAVDDSTKLTDKQKKAKLTDKQKKVIKDIEISQVLFDEYSYKKLFDLSHIAILGLKNQIIQTLTDGAEKPAEVIKAFEEAVEEFDVRTLGIAGIHQQVFSQCGEQLELPKLYVSTAGHYSWEKCLDIVGIGKRNVCRIEVDTHFQMHRKGFSDALAENAHALMVVGIVGTTEEGAIDPIEEMQGILRRSNKGGFFHIDGAYGGYFCSMLRDIKPKEGITADERRENIKIASQANAKFDLKYGYILEPIKKHLIAISAIDSIAIDPHKLGYVPYSAGSVFYADTRYKDFIYKSAPYLATSNIDIDPVEKTYLGGWTLEGSRAGATALACALSTEVISLDKAGYGKLMAETIRLTEVLTSKLKEYDANNDEIKIVPVYEPHGNIICFAVTAPNFIKKVEYINILTNAVWQQMTILPNRVLPDYQFITSKTDLAYRKYQEVIDKVIVKSEIQNDKVDKGWDDRDVLPELAESLYEQDFKLEFLRAVVMHPTIADYEVKEWNSENRAFENVPLFDAFVTSIRKAAVAALPYVLLEILKDNNLRTGQKQADGRISILWIENKKSFDDHQKALEIDEIRSLPAIGKYLDITFYNYKDGIDALKGIIAGKQFDCSVIDLNLADDKHTEWGTGLEVINTLYPENAITLAGKPILFSKFFDEPVQAQKLKYFFTSQFGNLFNKPRAQFLGKGDIARNPDETKQEHSAIHELVKSIYQVMQKNTV